jgi:DNA-binding transcriptional ArsR family regulator
MTTTSAEIDRVLMALNDGRALAASVLAAEAGLATSTVRSQLAKLTEAGLLQAETHGRHRYYRLAGPQIGELQIEPARQSNRNAPLRTARTCYDHLAGQLGVGIMAHTLANGYLVGGDGLFHPGTGQDRFNSYGRDVDYSLTRAGWTFLADIGITIPTGNRALIRYCIDWSEQRHHLAGQLGRAILDHFLAASWIRRRTNGRSVQITPQGRTALTEIFQIDAQTD